jgi:hypothetical protein
MSTRLPPMPPEPPKLQINPADLTDVTCENCNNFTFTEVVLLKHVSALLTPNGKATNVPIPVWACNACGFVNDGLLPEFMRRKTPDESTAEKTSSSILTDEAPKPSPTTIQIVK